MKNFYYDQIPLRLLQQECGVHAQASFFCTSLKKAKEKTKKLLEFSNIRGGWLESEELDRHKITRFFFQFHIDFF